MFSQSRGLIRAADQLMQRISMLTMGEQSNIVSDLQVLNLCTR